MKKLILLMAALCVSGLFAQTMQWAVRPTSAQIENYGQLLKMRKNGKCGLIDHHGREVIPADYDSISPFKDGYALAMNVSGKRLKIEGIISEGDYDLQPISEDIYATSYMWFSDGKMPVRGAGGWGYLGTDGMMAIPCQFQRAYPFSEGYASVEIDERAYYIDKNMDYLPIEVNRGDLTFASTFLGGEAVVYGRNMKGYVINHEGGKGGKVRNYDIKYNEVKVNKYDHSIGDRMRVVKEKVGQMSLDERFTIFEEMGLWGYKKGDKVILPAQLEKADPIRGGYGNVRFKGYNGVLHVIEGDFSSQVENNHLEINQGEVKPGYIYIYVPAELENANILLKMKDEKGYELPIQTTVAQGKRRVFSFRPSQIPDKSCTTSYFLETWCDNLLLWKSSCDITYDISHNIPNSTDVKKETVTRANLALSAPRASSKRANPKDEFFITIPVSNSGDERGDGSVTLYVDGKPLSSKGVSVRAHGIANLVFSIPDVKKERYVKVRGALRNGRSSQEVSIHLLPIW